MRNMVILVSAFYFAHFLAGGVFVFSVLKLEIHRFSNDSPEAYLGLCQTSMMEPFCKNS